MTEVAQKIWNFFRAKGMTDYGVAGLMGNLFAESGLSPINLQNSFEKDLKYTDTTYTAAVDDGSYTNFVNDRAGYGLAQWTHPDRKKKFLDYARAMKKSIGDLDMQLDFLWIELNASYKSVVAVLMSATSVRQASNAVLLDFERPKKKDEIKTQNDRAEYGQRYYNQFAKPEVTLKEFIQLFQELRSGLQDNDASAWSEAARSWAIQSGLFVGNGKTSAGDPNYMWQDFVTREQLVTVLYRFIESGDLK